MYDGFLDLVSIVPNCDLRAVDEPFIFDLTIGGFISLLFYGLDIAAVVAVLYMVLTLKLSPFVLF